MIEVMPLERGEERHMIFLARVMHAESPVYRDHPFDDERFLQWVELCLTSEDWLCLVAWKGMTPIGFIAVGAMEMLFSRHRTVDDLGLFVLPEHRGTATALRLVRAMEEWASSRAVKIRIGVTTGVHAERTQAFLERLGYTQTGVLLSKPA